MENINTADERARAARAAYAYTRDDAASIDRTYVNAAAAVAEATTCITHASPDSAHIVYTNYAVAVRDAADARLAYDRANEAYIPEARVSSEAGEKTGKALDDLETCRNPDYYYHRNDAVRGKTRCNCRNAEIALLIAEANEAAGLPRFQRALGVWLDADRDRRATDKNRRDAANAIACAVDTKNSPANVNTKAAEACAKAAKAYAEISKAYLQAAIHAKSASGVVYACDAAGETAEAALAFAAATEDFSDRVNGNICTGFPHLDQAFKAKNDAADHAAAAAASADEAHATAGHAIRTFRGQ